MSRCDGAELADATPIALPDGRWAIWSARVQLPIKMGSSQADLLSEVSRALGSLDRAHEAFAQAVADQERWDRLLAALPPDDVRALKRRVGAPAPHPPLLTARPMAPGLSALVQPDAAQPAATLAPQGAPRRGQVTAQTVKRFEDKQAAAAGGKSEGVGADLVSRLTELAAAGKTSPQIAQELGVTGQRVRAVAKRLGITLTPHSNKPAGAAELAPSWAQAYADGQTYQQIADASRYSLNTVKRELRELGVVSREQELRSAWIGQALELHQQGMSDEAIGQAVGRSKKVVYEALLEAGVTRRVVAAEPKPEPAPEPKAQDWLPYGIELRKQGKGVAEISRIVGRTRACVHERLTRAGLSCSLDIPSDKVIAAVAKELGVIHKVAETLGLDRRTVANALNREGIKLNVRSGSKKTAQETP